MFIIFWSMVTSAFIYVLAGNSSTIGAANRTAPQWPRGREGAPLTPHAFYGQIDDLLFVRFAIYCFAAVRESVIFQAVPHMFLCSRVLKIIVAATSFTTTCGEEKN